ncbi:hypothetical protein DM02DRAFT_647811 [Periconia macrospinosa]|uniref:Uncharacterized protein n=1 Tax=Periconia macrospinosa TaxID=97972 RepID=A0A2V1EFE5_9PLEO|nr:hypothetical protein DM02DRAFT_647811 [Periconia macrospinosa]
MAASQSSSSEGYIFRMSPPTVPVLETPDVDVSSFNRPTYGVCTRMLSGPRASSPKVTIPEMPPAEISVPKNPATRQPSPCRLVSEELSSEGPETDSEFEDDLDGALSLISKGFFDVFKRHLDELNKNVHGMVLRVFRREGNENVPDDEYKAEMLARMAEIIPVPLSAIFDTRKPITINIRRLIELGSRDDTHLFPEVPLATPIIPTKMVPFRGVVVKELDSEIASMLVDSVMDMFEGELGRDYGGQIGWTLAVQEDLHSLRHRLEPGTKCCFFRMMEEDFDGGDQISRTRDIEVFSFTFMCDTCKTRHDIRIFR